MKSLLAVLLCAMFALATTIPGCGTEPPSLDTFVGYANAAAGVAEANATPAAGPVACRALEVVSVTIPIITEATKANAQLAYPAIDIDITKCGPLNLALSTPAIEKAEQIVEVTVCGVAWAGDAATGVLSLLTEGKASIPGAPMRGCLAVPVSEIPQG